MLINNDTGIFQHILNPFIMKKLSILKITKSEAKKIVGGRCNTFTCSSTENCSGGTWGSGYVYNRKNEIMEHN